MHQRNLKPRAPEAKSGAGLRARQIAGNQILLPTTYLGQGGMSVGAVMGITLGVVLGILLVIMIVWWAMYQQAEGYVVEDESVSVGPRRRPYSRGSRIEIEQVRRTHSPGRRRVTEIVDEAYSPSVLTDISRRRSRRGADEEIIVYEDETETSVSEVPVRRVSSRGPSRRPPSGIRIVDPDRYGGGGGGDNYTRRPGSRRYD